MKRHVLGALFDAAIAGALIVILVAGAMWMTAGK